SVIRRNFPDDLSQKKHWGQNLATALEIFIPRSELQQGTDHPIIHFGYINWGYSWVFPNKDEIIIGLGGLNRKNDKRFKELFKNYIAEIVPSYQPDESQQKRIYGHPVPSGNYLRNPVYKSIMLVGDAAGFSDTISGEGIFQAQRSAEIASLSIYRSLNDGQPLKESYLKLLKKHMFPELFYAKLLRWFIFTALEKLNFNLIQMLTIRGEKRAIDIIHGLRTYKFMRRSEGIHDGILWGM
ncbi:MAG TPA: hypothetical protein VMU10_09760, partial [Desulfomonilia bacterium]|nr:hypothetical protein [Desulfomonilia bacterium]